MHMPLHTGSLSRFYGHALLAGVAVLMAGCVSTPTIQEKTAGWTPNKIYSEARSESSSGSYENAIPLYDVLEGRAAGTTLAQQAQLEKAYAQYQNGDIPQATATLERFISLNPSSPGIDYALYLKGIVNFGTQDSWMSFLTRQELAERDMQAAKDSFQSFKELVTRFPDSRYTPDAKQRMTYVINALAQSEVAIASYYYRRGAYVAAINRAQTSIRSYEGTPSQEEALAIMMNAYDKLGMEQPRDDTRRVLQQNYPQSTYLATEYTGKGKSFWQLW